MMSRYIADLHIHTLLSPCASVEMTPTNIITKAVEHGVDIIAITDHNACDNVEAVIAAAEGTSVTVLPGMEVETREEVHIVVLFDYMKQLRSWEIYVQQHMLGLINDESSFGGQFIVDANDEFIGIKPEMLLASLTCGIEEVTAKVSSIGGICIASHVDRPMYSILSQLGFIPADAALSAVEVSRRTTIAQARKQYGNIGNVPIITSSDAHTISDFVSGPKTVFHIEKPSLAEIKQALFHQNNRRVE